MFTGIVSEVGQLKSKKAYEGGKVSLEILSKKIKPTIGDSICVNGACLTVTQKTKSGFYVEVVNETLERTNLGKLEINAKINLEPSLKFSDKLDGHIVTGHIDTTAKILKTDKAGLVIQLLSKIKPFIAEKGSIAINGVSLTVARTTKNSFSAALIPFTLKNTNLGLLKKGGIVNIEVDIISRYLYNFIKR